MITYPFASLSPPPAVTDATPLAAMIACLSEPLTGKMAGAYPAAARFAMLVHAASRSDRIEHTAKILKNLRPVQSKSERLYYSQEAEKP
jgi:hypothetical protein